MLYLGHDILLKIWGKAAKKHLISRPKCKLLKDQKSLQTIWELCSLEIMHHIKKWKPKLYYSKWEHWRFYLRYKGWRSLNERERGGWCVYKRESTTRRLIERESKEHLTRRALAIELGGEDLDKKEIRDLDRGEDEAREV